ncbi:S-layer homology domain-containing protein [Helicovermis profundi]|uniref:SLH domain-containing protein n=1 Tax=Helicovermis profundi TaxID=3065157 RepID=A0AAU9EV87_9FIRM|nr:hypothetical protein HLPR_27010 [Clostridia bacterium S502]
MKKIFIFISLLVIMMFSNSVFSTDFVNVYDNLKSNYPSFVSRMINGGTSEAEIKSFLVDLSNEVNSTENLTESNFNSVMYNSLKKVLFKDGQMGMVKDKHYNFTITLLSVFSNEISKTLETKTLSGDLAALSSSVKSAVLNNNTNESNIIAPSDSKMNNVSPPSTGGSIASLGQTLDEEKVEKNVLDVTTKILGSKKELAIEKESFTNFVETEIKALKDKKVKEEIRNYNAIKIDLTSKSLGKEFEIKIPPLDKAINAANEVEIDTENVNLSFDRESLTDEDKKSQLTLNVKEDNNIYNIKLYVGNNSISKFKKPIKITLPYKLKSGEEGKFLSVFYVDALGKLTPMGGVYKEGKITFSTNHLSAFTVKINEKKFSDLKGYDWAKDKINSLASKGIINGKSQMLFDPSSPITRAEFTALITRMLSYSESNKEIDFKDVKKGKWYYENVKTAYEFGLMKGVSETNFNPEGGITTEEVLTVLSRIMKSKGYITPNYNDISKTYSENEISSWAKDDVGLTISLNLNKDIPLKDFIPNQKITRAEVASMLYEIINM